MEEIHKTFRPWDAAANATRSYSPASELPEDDLVFFLLETIPQLNSSAFYSQYAETRGAPPFDVELMCTLLAYSYCVGVFSSRNTNRPTGWPSSVPSLSVSFTLHV